MVFYALFCLACVLPVSVLGYPSQAGTEACLDLTPQHGATAQGSTSPYMLSVDATSVKQGGMVTVTLNATTASDTFNGFLVQARCTKCTTADTAIVPGTFAKYTASDDTIKTMDCENDTMNSMSHNGNAAKTSAKFTWKAPADFNVAEGIQFRATVVQVKVTWWADVTSDEITVTASSTSQVAPVLTLAVVSFIAVSSLLL
ncbi:putative ferric-chelate reductase 1 [Haliotis rubra]|uniref:putative ferric-chelate reductase 1 n=1 Tax=Haliotis rubra TaxID=36100 RepID=UPI001EE552B4|nr:putative ferric-chelate reductase 1 [Haliotis rubra]